MVRCGMCSKGFDSLKVFRLHLLSHGGSRFICGEDDCKRTFDICSVFLRHLRNFHKCSDNNTSVTENVSFNANEDPGCDPSGSHQAEEIVTDISDVSVDEFELRYKRSVELLVAKLYKNPSLPRNFVQTLIEDFDLFLSGGFLEILESKVMNALTAANVAPSCIAEIQNIFNYVKDPFKGLKTDHKRMKHFKSNDYYVPPITFTISESRPKLFHTKEGSIIKQVKTTGQFVPFRYVLKNLFELPFALSSTLNYVNFLKSVPANVIRNVVQGKLWKSKVAHFNDTDKVFQADFYYDDVEPNADLGPHSEKLGAGYLLLPALPPACQSKLENIFLVLLIDADDRKSCVPGKTSYNREVFKPVVDEFNYLETKGILCNTSDLGVKRIFFVLNVIRGDNLGVHGVMGFAEGFTANFPCTICRAPKLLTQSMTKENESLLRTVENYSEDLAQENMALTGVKELCVFNSVKSFHVAQSLSIDLMHDGAEDMSHYVLLPVLQHCIESKYFSLEVLNSRIFLFDYGPSDSANKPVPVPLDFRTRTKLKGTAREVMTLVRLLGVIVGDLVPSTDQFWKLYLLHKDIMEITHAKELPLDVLDELRIKIHVHHSLYLELVDRCLPPKFHYFLHYSRKSTEIGPPVHLSSMRAESKHREVVTKYAHAITSRRNLPLSIAIKHQLTMCFRFVSKAPLIPPLICGPGEVIDVEDHLHYLGFKSSLPSLPCSKVHRVNWVNVEGTDYKPRMVLVTGVSNSLAFKFRKIKDIFIISDKPLFVCEHLKNLGYDEHVGGYEVDYSNLYSCVFHEDLYDPFPLYDFLMCTGLRYVVFKHYL
ncbi:Zinc finger protein C25B8.19c [Frankliniella fusca]|uniref:Zinc finger protein C25B8.19c n=1 Tax=Frankliniella fusca TaxID=407009 RepID=A0AAE1GQ98_9NEOP|nr:Zinc finger protein C25B8.19c [Frankliniella fusca]